MAFDPGLVDTLVSGARTYGAPELVGLTTLGIALAMRGYTHGLAVAVLGLVWGAGHHPLAAGVGLGLLFLWPSNLGRGVRRWALGLGALLAVPRALRLGDMLMCGGALWLAFSGSPRATMSALGRRLHNSRRRYTIASWSTGMAASGLSWRGYSRS